MTAATRSLAALALLALCLTPAAVGAQTYEDDVRPSPTPRGGPAGSEVVVTMEELPPDTRLLIGFGAVGAGYEMIGQGDTDAEGRLEVAVTVPRWARPHEGHFFFVAFDDLRPRAVSDLFLVTGPDGRVRVQGRVRGSGAGGCLLLEGPAGETLALTGDLPRVPEGERVLAVGRVAAGSPCLEGLPIRVERLERGR